MCRVTDTDTYDNDDHEREKYIAEHSRLKALTSQYNHTVNLIMEVIEEIILNARKRIPYGVDWIRLAGIKVISWKIYEIDQGRKISNSINLLPDKRLVFVEPNSNGVNTVKRIVKIRCYGNVLSKIAKMKIYQYDLKALASGMLVKAKQFGVASYKISGWQRELDKLR